VLLLKYYFDVFIYYIVSFIFRMPRKPGKLFYIFYCTVFTEILGRWHIEQVRRVKRRWRRVCGKIDGFFRIEREVYCRRVASNWLRPSPAIYTRH